MYLYFSLSSENKRTFFPKPSVLWEYCESSESADRLEGKNGLQGMSYGLAYFIPEEVSVYVNSPGTAIC